MPKQIAGIKNKGTKGFVKILNPVKGLITCKKEKLQTIVDTPKAIKNTQRIIVALLSEISTLYFTFFCSLMLDLKLTLEASSCIAPNGHAAPQNNLPNTRTERSNSTKITIIGIIT